MTGAHYQDKIFSLEMGSCDLLFFFFFNLFQSGLELQSSLYLPGNPDDRYISLNLAIVKMGSHKHFTQAGLNLILNSTSQVAKIIGMSQFT
jgi:hypothetical protein